MGETEDERAQRSVPASDLDLTMMTTDPKWGSDVDVHDKLRERLKVLQPVYDELGNVKGFDEFSIWNFMNFYTRDMRLANLEKEEVVYCQYYLDLAGDFLQSMMNRAFIISLSRAVTVMELSQSKKGFLRRRMGTFTKENYQQEIEPAKRSIFGGKKEGQ